MKKKQVLIIDDSLEVLDCLGYYRKGKGFDLLTASNGFDGISLFKKNAVDIVIVDIRMTGLDGWYVINAMKTNNASTPIIVFSGDHSEGNHRKVMKFRVSKFLTKPCSFETILDPIENVLGTEEGIE